VVLSAPDGLFEYNGKVAQRLTLEQPPPPLVTVISGAGSLPGGDYHFAAAFTRDGMEGPMSDMIHVSPPQEAAFEVVLPTTFAPDITHVRLYMSNHSGTTLQLVEERPLASASMTIPTQPALGVGARFPWMAPMPAGKYLGLWQGRLLTAHRNVLNFSEPLAYHIHDPRHGFIQMPQRITFVAPMENGIWVGQVDHVIWLAGTNPAELLMQRRATHPPVPGSALLIPSETAGEAAQGGKFTAIWLSGNGYVLGTAGGELIETGANLLSGIFGNSSQTAQAGERLHTLCR